MMDNNEDNYLMLSGIQHFNFCRRQWALIHVEQQWEENVLTIEGHHVHRKVDQPFIKEKRGNTLIVRALPVKSEQLKISGVCDVVEFIKDESGVEIVGREGKFIPYPVEYKRGRAKKDLSDILQLTAQAMCLEEMLLCDVPIGYLFYNEEKKRIEVPITQENKNIVINFVKEMHQYYQHKYTPKVKTGPFCKKCSLLHLCLPSILNKRSVRSYIEGKLKE